MNHDYTSDQLRDALHTASIARAGLNISTFSINRDAWTEAHIADLQEVLKALPERSVDAWIATTPEDLVEGDTYRVRDALGCEIILRVTDQQTRRESWTQDVVTVYPHATALYHPQTGQRYTFHDVTLHADMVLEKAERVYHVKTVEEALQTLHEFFKHDIHPLHLMAFIQRGDLPVYTYGNNIVLNTKDIQEFLTARAAGQAIVKDALREDISQVEQT